MSTSADTLMQIINEIAKDFSVNKDKILENLTEKELLPKKILKMQGTVFATTKAKDFAEENGIVPDGEGSGRGGKFTITDLKKMLKPVPKKTLITPSAEQFAKNEGIDIKDVIGTGQDDRITLKDIKGYISKCLDEDKINISAHAQAKADKNNLTLNDFKKIVGSGDKGRIVVKDIDDYLSQEDDEPKKKTKKETKKEESSDEEDKFPMSDDED